MGGFFYVSRSCPEFLHPRNGYCERWHLGRSGGDRGVTVSRRGRTPLCGIPPLPPGGRLRDSGAILAVFIRSFARNFGAIMLKCSHLESLCQFPPGSGRAEIQRDIRHSATAPQWDPPTTGPPDTGLSRQADTSLLLARCLARSITPYSRRQHIRSQDTRACAN